MLVGDCGLDRGSSAGLSVTIRWGPERDGEDGAEDSGSSCVVCGAGSALLSEC